MKLSMCLLGMFVFIVSGAGCDGRAFGSLTGDACLASCINYDECDVEHPEGDCEESCDDEFDRTGDCDAAAFDYYICLGDASCGELARGFGACPVEFGDFGDACGF